MVELSILIEGLGELVVVWKRLVYLLYMGGGSAIDLFSVYYMVLITARE